LQLLTAPSKTTSTTATILPTTELSFKERERGREIEKKKKNERCHHQEASGADMMIT
jgi:hypothetical protein